MANIGNLKPFVKGDKRINRKGRIDNFVKLRKLAQEIGNEPSAENETEFAALLRRLAKSKNPADRALFLAYAVGKPKDEIEHSGESGLTIKIIKASDDTSNNSDK